MADGSRGHGAAQGRQSFAADECAVSTMAVVMLVAATVVTATAPVAYVKLTDGISGPAISDYTFSADKGADGQWGTGDEQIVVRYNSGEVLMAHEVQVLIQSDFENTVLEGDALDVPLEQPFSSSGTSWTHTETIQQGDHMHVQIVLQRAFTELLVEEDYMTAGSNMYGGPKEGPSSLHVHDHDHDHGGEGQEGGEGEGEDTGGFVICHRPPGNPGNQHTITVGSQNAVNAHLGHGDHEGPCA